MYQLEVLQATRGRDKLLTLQSGKKQTRLDDTWEKLALKALF